MSCSSLASLKPEPLAILASMLSGIFPGGRCWISAMPCICLNTFCSLTGLARLIDTATAAPCACTHSCIGLNIPNKVLKVVDLIAASGSDCRLLRIKLESRPRPLLPTIYSCKSVTIPSHRRSLLSINPLYSWIFLWATARSSILRASPGLWNVMSLFPGSICLAVFSHFS